MIKIENVVLPSPKQWKAIIRGMRNPKNSWEKSDSYSTHIENAETLNIADFEFFMGDNDLELANKLSNGGPVHAKYRRMIGVYVDITAPLYWWKEFDTYKCGTVANSCSTMHKIQDKEFTLGDFSREHLSESAMNVLQATIYCLNFYRQQFLSSKEKSDWWQMIQLLPSSYNQKRTVFLNYEVLANIYRWRKDHKLDEWQEFCEWIKTLPYSELITKPIHKEIQRNRILSEMLDAFETYLQDKNTDDLSVKLNKLLNCVEDSSDE